MSDRTAYWLEIFSQREAFWQHDNNPHRPHALLTKGGHSNGFFNWSMVAQDPGVVASVTVDLSFKVREYCTSSGAFSSREIDRIVGPAEGAITLADRLASRFPGTKSGYTEKKEGKCITRFPVEGDRLLVCEDTITTAGSVLESIKALEEAGATVLPAVVCVLNRSGMTEVKGRSIISLIDLPLSNWDPAECPLCKMGSVPIRPKAPKENWQRLNAAY